MPEPDDGDILPSIRDLIGREPFAPFTIVLTSGDRYKIEAPRNLVEMKSELFYAYPRSDKFVLIRKNQIVAIERPQETKARKR